MIKVEIVADSIARCGVRLTTFVLTYPRFIHAEFMTHRMISRNASSSRAIPVKKQIQMVIDNPVIPLAFTKNQKGMQGGEALAGEQEAAAVEAWLNARNHAVAGAQYLSDLEVHKQYANRILEPWAHITVVATATAWDNFFALRCHEMAQPEIHELADQMYAAYNAQFPTFLEDGQWHLPFVNGQTIVETIRELSGDPLESPKYMAPVSYLIKRSVARCARVSYLNHDGTSSTLQQDVELHDRLVGSAPIHASPAEHQAMATSEANVRSGNLKGWLQYRKSLLNENVDKFEGPK